MAKKATNTSTGYQSQDYNQQQQQQQSQNQNQSQSQNSRNVGQQNSGFNPYAPAGNGVNEALAQARDLFARDQLVPQAYGNMVADESMNTMQAREGIARTAANNQTTQQAQDAWGNLMNADPYAGIDLVQENALREAMPAAASYFSNSGMLNSSVAGENMAETAARAVAPIHYDAYNQAQNRRLQGLAMAPQMQQMAYYDDQMLGAAGASQDARSQALLNDQARQYYENGNRDWESIQRLLGATMPATGIGGTSYGSSIGWNQGSGSSSGMSMGSSSGSSSGSSTGSSMSESEQDPGVMGTLGGLLSVGGALGGLF